MNYFSFAGIMPIVSHIKFPINWSHCALSAAFRYPVGAIQAACLKEHCPPALCFVSALKDGGGGKGGESG